MPKPAPWEIQRIRWPQRCVVFSWNFVYLTFAPFSRISTTVATDCSPIISSLIIPWLLRLAIETVFLDLSFGRKLPLNLSSVPDKIHSVFHLLKSLLTIKKTLWKRINCAMNAAFGSECWNVSGKASGNRIKCVGVCIGWSHPGLGWSHWIVGARLRARPRLNNSCLWISVIINCIVVPAIATVWA